MTAGKNSPEDFDSAAAATPAGREDPLVAPYEEDDDAVTQQLDTPRDDQPWVVQVSSADRRLLSTEQLRIEFQAGRLSSETPVWRGGLYDWTPLGGVEVLTSGSHSVLPAAAAPPRRVPPSEPPPSARSWPGAAAGRLQPAIAEARATAPVPPGWGLPAPKHTPAPRLAATSPNWDVRASSPRPGGLATLLGPSAGASLAVFVTSYALLKAGVFESSAPAVSVVSEPTPSGSARRAATATASGSSEASSSPPVPAREQAADKAQEGVPEAAAVPAKQPENEASPEGALTETPPPEANGVRSKAEKRRRRADSARATEAKKVPHRSASETPAQGNAFNRQAATTALDAAAGEAQRCRPTGGPSGAGTVQVSYEPSGKVAAVEILTPGFENTLTGSCIRMLFRRAKVPAFAGAGVVLKKSFQIP